MLWYSAKTVPCRQGKKKKINHFFTLPINPQWKSVTHFPSLKKHQILGHTNTHSALISVSASQKQARPRMMSSAVEEASSALPPQRGHVTVVFSEQCLSNYNYKLTPCVGEAVFLWGRVGGGRNFKYQMYCFKSWSSGLSFFRLPETAHHISGQLQSS